MTALPAEVHSELTTVASTYAIVHEGLSVQRLDQLTPDTDYELAGFSFRTLPLPDDLLCRFATVNDVHFGEVRCGVVGGHPEIGPVCQVEPGQEPHPLFMNRAAAQEIANIDPVQVLVKGDLTDAGELEQYEQFRSVYATFGERLLTVRGNHESYHHMAVEDDPVQCRDLPGVRIILLDTSIDGAATGAVSAAQLDQVDSLAAESPAPVLLFGHHHPWDPSSAKRSETYFGINPDDSEKLVALVARRKAIWGYFAGHTHRNRVRRFAQTGSVPWVEVSAVKDYPGGWAEYQVFDGAILQIFHRISSPEALAWTEKTRQMFHGLYGAYSFGDLADRCFQIPDRG